ncbi:hypothetical protein F4827_007026, partial [Paraburkholderia bannensis]
SDSPDSDDQARQVAQALYQGKGSDLSDTLGYAQLIAASLGEQWAGMGNALFVEPVTQATRTVLAPAEASLNDAWRQTIVAAWNRRRIEAITDVHHRPLSKLVKGGLMRGVEITVTLDAGRFAGHGDLELFGSMLNRFLGLYATVNLYTKLVIVAQPTGQRIEWPETKGEGAPF